MASSHVVLQVTRLAALRKPLHGHVSCFVTSLAIQTVAVSCLLNLADAMSGTLRKENTIQN
jgi:hypothetical protein